MNQAASQTNMTHIPLNQIVLNTYNSRKFDRNMTPARKAAFDELTDSIRQKDIIQPIVVRPIIVDGESRFEVMAGERRYRSKCRIANEDGIALDGVTIPSVIKDVDDADAFDIMITENFAREDLTPYEKAESFSRYITEKGDTNEVVVELSERTNVPVHAIRRLVALLSLPQMVKDAWRDEVLTQGHLMELTRVTDPERIESLARQCINNKWTVKDLKISTSAQAPLMETARFDTAQCQYCGSNSGLESALFADMAEAPKCLDPKCFEKKQEDFFKANWQSSKAKEILGTNGHRFAHNLTVADRQPVKSDAVNERCKSCPEFVSVVSLAGQTIPGQEQVCVGSRDCFTQLYLKTVKSLSPAVLDVDVEKSAETKTVVATEDDKASQPATSKQAEADTAGKAKDAAPEKSEAEMAEDDKKRSKKRSEKFIEEFFKTSIPTTITTMSSTEPMAVKLAITALAISSSEAAGILSKSLGQGQHLYQQHKIADAVFALKPEDICPILLKMTVGPVMKTDAYSEGAIAMRRVVSKYIGIDITAQWVINADYLNDMRKREIVKMGEEAGTDLWNLPEVLAYRNKEFGEKGWMSLKKDQLIDCILKSGADLKGRIPKEMVF